MGYYKQLEIANQVEEADRFPAPLPARDHVALSGGMSRRVLIALEKQGKNRIVLRRDLVIGVSIVLAVLIIGGWIL